MQEERSCWSGVLYWVKNMDMIFAASWWEKTRCQGLFSRSRDSCLKPSLQIFWQIACIPHRTCGEGLGADFGGSLPVNALWIPGKRKITFILKSLSLLLWNYFYLCWPRKGSLHWNIKKNAKSNCSFCFCPIFTLNLTTFYVCFLLKKYSLIIRFTILI